MGKQPDGSFIVSTGRRIEPASFAFDYRPIDLALHPSGQFFAVLNQSNVFLADDSGVIAGSTAQLSDGAAYRGAVWSPDGSKLYVSVSEGYVQELSLTDRKLTPGRRITFTQKPGDENPRPGGLVITRDGTHLIAALADRNAVAEVDLGTYQVVHEYPVQNIPFAVRLTGDERRIVVSNWGGRPVEEGDDQAESGNAAIVVDSHGAAASGTVSILDRASGQTTNIPVGLHPTDIVIHNDHAFVADAASDAVTDIDLQTNHVARTIPVKWGALHLFGAMPDALAVHGNTLYVCAGGDNAVAEVDLASGAARGFRPAGYFPVSIALSSDAHKAYVLNTKGNGSVRRTVRGQIGNAHDFQGSVSILDLQADLGKATETVAKDNMWRENYAALHPNLAVYNGAIKHVLYIIKENRTYDEVLGDIPKGNGMPRLCDLGEAITPNAHALVNQFTLFDNAYVTGTNSADGHQWSTQALANDYLEHFYTGYRTYPDDGDCAMSISAAGAIWDAALRKGRTLKDYGEFCDDELAVFTPIPKDWNDVWQDRIHHTHRYQFHVGTRVASLRPYVHPRVVYWPLLQSDQQRADIFIGDYQRMSRERRVPNLMLLTLPCDHTEGRDPKYPKPQCMVADNDLALGRVVEAVSHSAEWKDTCIFVIEDDAQSGPDHVDGHRTVYMAISPYVRRGFVDSSMETTLSMIKSIELMLGLDPMNRFDGLTPPITNCFTDSADLSGYKAVPNRTPIDIMNPSLAAQSGKERYWTQRSLALDWSGPDRANPEVLNRVLWHSLHGMDVPYPAQRQSVVQ
jgi:DNA-binding beta-propeller fold protein YncE